MNKISNIKIINKVIKTNYHKLPYNSIIYFENTNNNITPLKGRLPISLQIITDKIQDKKIKKKWK